MKRFQILTTLTILIGAATAVELPYDIKKLQIQRAQRIAEIDRTYLRELEKLKLTYTKAGNLEVVVVVERLIKELDPGDLPKTDGDLQTFLQGTAWEFDKGRTITFGKNGKLKKSWGVLEPKWRVKGMKVYFESKVLVFDETFSTVKETTKTDLHGVGKRAASK